MASRGGRTVPTQPTSRDYELLLQLRTDLRRFLRWSEEQAAQAGLTPGQHQLLLAIRGHPDPRGPTITDVAGYLMIRHHSAVGLVDRAVRAGLVRRVTDASDARVVRLKLAPAGARSLAGLVRASTEELARLRRDFAALGGARDADRTSAPTERKRSRRRR